MQEGVRKYVPSVDLQEKLNQLLAVLKTSYDTPQQWKVFYQFVAKAYMVSEEQRPSVSKLTDILREAGIPKPGSLAVLYAHGLYILAVQANVPIYKTFNP